MFLSFSRSRRRVETAKLLASLCLCLLSMGSRAQDAQAPDNSRAKRVLLIFSEARDLPGNLMMEQSVRSEMQKTNRMEFFTESLDSGRFPNAKHYRVFRDYLKNKYSGQNLDLVMMFMSRDFMLAQEIPADLVSNLPTVFVVVNDLDVPEPPGGRPFTGIFRRFDVQGTIKFIFHLQPDTRHVVVVGGTSVADHAVLARIAAIARSVDGVKFEFWTNRPVADVCEAAKTLPSETVILMGTMQRDVAGQPVYTSQIVQRLAPSASVPVYVLGASLIGSGALGGEVVDFEDVGGDAARLALRALAGTPVSQIPVEIESNGVPMVDWSALQRWRIKAGRLPADCVVMHRPLSAWDVFKNHVGFILFVSFGFLAQAVTIAALLLLRQRQHRAEAEILRQRAELAHVTRVSMMGQLASALTHELNQPLGAILRNAEAAEIYLQAEHPNLDEVRAILTDIRRDDKRAGNVIDGMRSLFKRQKLTSEILDMRALVEDTIAMARPDAVARQVKLKVEIPGPLSPAQGDRVHVQQVLLNLILNGMDAMNSIPKSKRALVVGVAETKNGNLRVTVSDCGIGVPPDDAVHLFEPFFTTKSKGMGMGLAISRTIIEAHGGEIWMRSSAMDGTTFTFILPPAGLDKVKPGDLPAPS